MRGWELIKDNTGRGMLRLEYGDVRASVCISRSPNMFSFYEISWDAIDFQGERGYAGKTCISQYEIVRKQMDGHRITDQTVIEFMEPAADAARFALFCCVVEKFI